MTVYYLCDGYACPDRYKGQCPFRPCKRTSKIAHAINFTKEVTNPEEDSRFEKLSIHYFEKEQTP